MAGYNVNKRTVIVTGASAGKKLMIRGKDPRLMTALPSAAPSEANALYARIMKSTGFDMFKKI